MENAATVTSAVVLVSDLDRSVTFYRDLFDCDVAIDGPRTALLLAPGGFQIYLKLIGKRSPHPSHHVGVQSLLWSTDSATRLDRYERMLRDHGYRTQTYTTGGVRFVMGRDPDGIRVVITHPSPKQHPRSIISSRLFN